MVKDKDMHSALNGIPSFAGKVFPVIQVTDGNDGDIELPSIVYTRAGSEPQAYLDEPMEEANRTYQVIIFAREQKDLDTHEDEVQEALEDALDLQDFRHFEDTYREEDGGIFVRVLLAVVG